MEKNLMKSDLEVRDRFRIGMILPLSCWGFLAPPKHIISALGVSTDIHSRDLVSSVQTTTMKWLVIFAGGESCLQFVKNAVSVQLSKAKRNKTRYACVSSQPNALYYCQLLLEGFGEAGVLWEEGSRPQTDMNGVTGIRSSGGNTMSHGKSTCCEAEVWVCILVLSSFYLQ